MDKVLIKRPDGAIRILVPAPEALAKGRTIQQIVERVIAADETWEVVDDSIFPDDRYFRDAWVSKNNKIEVNVDKASDIKMEKIRKIRNRELSDLDHQFSKAQEDYQTANISKDIAMEEIETLDYQLKTEQAKKPADQDDIEIASIKVQIKDKKAYVVEQKQSIKESRAIIKELADKKQALRDIPQNTDLKKYDLDRMQKYVPKELVHRTDVE